jgi:hypothetical protein
VIAVESIMRFAILGLPSHQRREAKGAIMADNWKNDPSQSGGKSGNMPDPQHKPGQGQHDQGQQRPGQPNPSQHKPSDKESDRNRQSDPQKKAS